MMEATVEEVEVTEGVMEAKLLRKWRSQEG